MPCVMCWSVRRNSGSVKRAADNDASEKNFRIGLVSGRGFGDFVGMDHERLAAREDRLLIGDGERGGRHGDNLGC